MECILNRQNVHEVCIFSVNKTDIVCSRTLTVL